MKKAVCDMSEGQGRVTAAFWSVSSAEYPRMDVGGDTDGLAEIRDVEYLA